MKKMGISIKKIVSNTAQDYSKVPKLLWKSMREKTEEYPEGIFQKFPTFFQLINQSYPKDKISLAYFIEIMPPLLGFYFTSWIISDRFRKFFAGCARAINKQEENLERYFKSLSEEN